jgi:DNA-binding NarL/FixJ family response regulator
VRILIVDDNAIVREGLVLWLGAEPDLQVVGEADTGRGGVAMAAQLEPDVVLMDISLPDISGIEAARLISTADDGPVPAIVCISLHLERKYAVAAFAAGVRGYVTKNGLAEELVPAIRTVVGGGRFASSHLDPALVAELVGDPD